MRALQTIILVLLTLHLVSSVSGSQRNKQKKRPPGRGNGPSTSASANGDESSGELQASGTDDNTVEHDATPRAPHRGRTAHVAPPSAASAGAGSTTHPAGSLSRIAGNETSLNPLSLDDPGYVTPAPPSPEHIGRRYLALQQDPPGRDFYHRLENPPSPIEFPVLGRQIERRLHTYFIFDDEQREARYHELRDLICILIHRLEAETDADAVLHLHRPEEGSDTTSTLFTRGIAASSRMTNTALRWMHEFRRFIAAARHEEYEALRRQSDEELDVFQGQQARRAEAAAKMRQSLEEYNRAAAGASNSRPNTRAQAQKASQKAQKVVTPPAPLSPPLRPKGGRLEPHTPAARSPGVIDLCTPSPKLASTIDKGKGKAAADPALQPLPDSPLTELDDEETPWPEFLTSLTVRAPSSQQAAAHRAATVISSSDPEEQAGLDCDTSVEQAVRLESIRTARLEDVARQKQVDNHRVASTSYNPAFDILRRDPGPARLPKPAPAAAAARIAAPPNRLAIPPKTPADAPAKPAAAAADTLLELAGADSTAEPAGAPVNIVTAPAAAGPAAAGPAVAAAPALFAPPSAAPAPAPAHAADVPAVAHEITAPHVESARNPSGSSGRRQLRARSLHLPQFITAALTDLEIPGERWASFEYVWRAFDGREYPAQIRGLIERFMLDIDEDDVDWLAAVFLRKE